MQVIDVAVLDSIAYPEEAALDVIEGGFVDELHREHPKGALLAERRGPVDVRLHVAVLRKAGKHDDDARALLPDHAPEVGKGRKERGLRGDVLLLENVIGVDVVASFTAGVLEAYAGVLARENVRITVLRCGPIGGGRWEIQDSFAEAHGLVG